MKKTLSLLLVINSFLPVQSASLREEYQEEVSRKNQQEISRKKTNKQKAKTAKYQIEDEFEEYQQDIQLEAFEKEQKRATLEREEKKQQWLEKQHELKQRAKPVEIKAKKEKGHKGLHYTTHALERMEQREIQAEQINRIVATGKKEPGNRGTQIYTEKGKNVKNSIKVVLDPSSKVVITVYRQDLDQELTKKKERIIRAAKKALKKVNEDKSLSDEERKKRIATIKSEKTDQLAKVMIYYSTLMKEKAEFENPTT